MSTWHEILNRPQNLWLRKLLFQVHLWVGIGLGLYVVLIGVTGAALVFREEMEHAIEKPLFDVEAATAQGPSADLLSVASTMRAAYPDRILTSIVNPRPEHSTIRGYLRDKNEKFIAVDAHPVTGAILGIHSSEQSFLRWLADLHFNLLAGRTGRIFNGVGAACLFSLCLTGAIIWWPGIKNWKRSLTVDFSKKWKRANWDLHSATGFWSLAVLAMWAFTGMYFAWPTEFRAAINWFSPVSLAQVAKSDVQMKGKFPPPDPRALLAEAKRHTPNGQLLSISFPADDKAYIRVFLGREQPFSYDTADYHYFDQFTGKHLGVWQRGLNQSAGDIIISWIGPLHFGTFGKEGMANIAVKSLWVILGLAPPLLAISGFLMYWNRFLSKRWALLRRRELSSAQPELASQR